MISFRSLGSSPRGHALLALAAQGSTSLSNLLLTVLVARSTGVVEFAAYALILPTYVVAQRFWRVFILVPHQVSLNQQGVDASNAARAPVFSSVRVAIAFSVATLAVTALVGDPYLRWGSLLALSMPIIAAYDSVRNTAFATGQLPKVALMDHAWLILQLIGSVIVAIASLAPWWYAVAWLIPPLIIALTLLSDWERPGLVQTGTSRRGPRLLDAISDLFSSTLVAQSIPYIIAVLATVPIAGAFRGAQTLTGPLNVLVMGLMPLVQNHTARNARRLERVVQLTRNASITFTGGAAIYAIALVALPDSIGVRILGDTWTISSDLLPGVALLMCLRTPFLTITTSLRSLGRIRQIVQLRTSNAIALLAAAAAASAFTPAIWIAPSMAFVSFATACVAWKLLIRPSPAMTERLTS